MDKLFSNHTEYQFWTLRNCSKCNRYDPDEDGITTCEIENAIVDSSITGQLDDDIYRRMGGKSGKCLELDS